MQNKDGHLSGFQVSGLRPSRSKSDPSQPTSRPASVAFKPPRSVRRSEGQVKTQAHAESEVQGFPAISEDVKAYFDSIPSEMLNCFPSKRQDPPENLFKKAADLLHHEPDQPFQQPSHFPVNQPLRPIQPSVHPLHPSPPAGLATQWDSYQNLPPPSSSHSEYKTNSLYIPLAPSLHSEYRLSSSQPHNPTSCHNGVFSVGMSSLSQPGQGGDHGWGVMASEPRGWQSGGGQPTVDRAEHSVGAMHPLGVSGTSGPDVTHHRQHPLIICNQQTGAQCTAFPGSAMPSPGHVSCISALAGLPPPICSESLRPSNRGTLPKRQECCATVPVNDEPRSEAFLIHELPPDAGPSIAQSTAITHNGTEERMQEAKQPSLPIQNTSPANNPQPSPAALPPQSEVHVKRPLRQDLASWIPHTGVAEAFKVKQLYPWQAGALECGEDGSNLVYCAPTSGGKSLVSEVLMIRQLLRHISGHKMKRVFGRVINPPAVRALLIVPFITIVQEKTPQLQALLSPLGLQCRAYAGEERGSPLTAQDETVAVCTIEKANTAINRLVLEGRLHELVCVVVDEAHMVTDPERGLALELSLSKLMTYRKLTLAQHPGERPHPSPARPAPSPDVVAALGKGPLVGPQIVCMSATMGGLDTMCRWLNARLFMTNFRPVTLQEHAVFGRKVYGKLSVRNLSLRATIADISLPPVEPASVDPTSSSGSTPVGVSEAAAAGNGPTAKSPLPLPDRPVDTTGGPRSPLVEVRTLADVDGDKDGLVALVAEVAALGQSTLVFCGTKRHTESCAEQLAQVLPSLPGLSTTPEVEDRRRMLVEALVMSTGGRGSLKLAHVMRQGVAFHHAGLTSQERHHVEAGFRSGAILTLTATSTLAAGVNLPARRVILRSLDQGPQGPVPRSTYLQMVGRAGRAGQSSIGESFIIGRGPALAASGDWPAVCAVMTAPLPALRSCLIEVCSEGDGGTSSVTSAQRERKQLQYQQMMLEGIANGSATNDSTIKTLITSTLLSHQVPYSLLRSATERTLTSLTEGKFIVPMKPDRGGNQTLSGGAASTSSLPANGREKWLAGTDASNAQQGKQPSGGGGHKYFMATEKGSAVYRSGLPTAKGVQLFDRLCRAQQTFLLGSRVHAIYVCMMLDDGATWDIFNWDAWAGLYRSRMTAAGKQVFACDGIREHDIGCRSGMLKPDVAKRHGRLAVAVLLDLCHEYDVEEVAEHWGQKERLFRNGFTAGQLQKVQKDLCQWAGMAKLICTHANWWAMEIVMQNLAEEADAGVRLELVPLMKVPGMTGARARALHSAGIVRPDLLAVAKEDDVKSIIAVPVPKGKTKAVINTLSASLLVARAATSLISEARNMMAMEAQQAALQSCVEDADFEVLMASLEAPPAGRGPEQAKGTSKEGSALKSCQDDVLNESDNDDKDLEVHATARCHEIQEELLNLPAPHPSTRGRATLIEFHPGSDPRHLDELLKQLSSQKQVAISLALPKSWGTTDETSVGGGDAIEARGGPTGGLAADATARTTPLGQLILDGSELTCGAVRGGGLEVPVPIPRAAAMDSPQQPPNLSSEKNEAGPPPLFLEGPLNRMLPCPGIALCWSHNTCAFLHLDRVTLDAASNVGPGASKRQRTETRTAGNADVGGSSSALAPMPPQQEAAATAEYLSRVWQAIERLLSNPRVVKCCFASRQQLAALFALHRDYLVKLSRQEATRLQLLPGDIGPVGSSSPSSARGDVGNGNGMAFSGALIDPQAMRWCRGFGGGSFREEGGLAGIRGEELSLKAAVRATIADYVLLVPMLEHEAVRRACRFALASFSMAERLPVTASYAAIEAPLALMLAEAAVPGLCPGVRTPHLTSSPHALVACPRRVKLRLPEVQGALSWLSGRLSELSSCTETLLCRNVDLNDKGHVRRVQEEMGLLEVPHHMPSSWVSMDGGGMPSVFRAREGLPAQTRQRTEVLAALMSEYQQLRDVQHLIASMAVRMETNKDIPGPAGTRSDGAAGTGSSRSSRSSGSGSSTGFDLRLRPAVLGGEGDLGTLGPDAALVSRASGWVTCHCNLGSARSLQDMMQQKQQGLDPRGGMEAGAVRSARWLSWVGKDVVAVVPYVSMAGQQEGREGLMHGLLLRVHIPPPYDLARTPTGYGLPNSHQSDTLGVPSGPLSASSAATADIVVWDGDGTPGRPRVLSGQPCSCVWLLEEACRPGLFDEALRRGTFHRLSPVVVRLCPLRWIEAWDGSESPIKNEVHHLTDLDPMDTSDPHIRSLAGVLTQSPPSSPTPFFLTVCVPLMRLIVLSLLTHDASLASALAFEAQDPWEALARTWWSHPNSGIPARLRPALDPTTALPTSLTDEDAATNRLPSPAWLPRDPDRPSLGLVAQVMVDSLYSGEGPKQLSRRLSLGCGGMMMSSLSRDEAAELFAGFLRAFDAVSTHRVALVQEAVKGRRALSLSSRPVPAPPMDLRKLTPSVQARLARALQASQLRMSAADLMRAVVVSMGGGGRGGGGGSGGGSGGAGGSGQGYGSGGADVSRGAVVVSVGEGAPPSSSKEVLGDAATAASGRGSCVNPLKDQPPWTLSDTTEAGVLIGQRSYLTLDDSDGAKRRRLATTVASESHEASGLEGHQSHSVLASLLYTIGCTACFIVQSGPISEEGSQNVLPTGSTSSSGSTSYLGGTSHSLPLPTSLEVRRGYVDTLVSRASRGLRSFIMDLRQGQSQAAPFRAALGDNAMAVSQAGFLFRFNVHWGGSMDLMLCRHLEIVVN